MRGVTVKSPENVARAQQMRRDGRRYKDIAAEFGINTRTAFEWVNDPDGAKLAARKRSYAGVCIDCGTSTSGSEGVRSEPRCHQCAVVKAGFEKTVWTRDALVLAIQEWTAIYGDPPRTSDWCPWQARSMGHESRARRFEDADGHWPSFTTVVEAFGSWNAAVSAAGLRPRQPGGNRRARAAA